MNEPRVVKSVTNECQSLGRAHESSSARAEQLIACLEGEIAKRDAWIVELKQYEYAFNEWLNKTEWVQEESASFSAKYLGLHRADIMRDIIYQLLSELSTIKAQEPVAWTDGAGAMYSASLMASLNISSGGLTPLYAAPVASPQVVMPERKKLPDLMMAEYHEVRGWNACLNEVARLNAAPAAPAADAGLVEALGYQVLFDAIAAATSVYANVAINISVQAFRAALAAHRAKGVV